jgi:predicted SnoaL-like aldol condensation-catalyzing enzyme
MKKMTSILTITAIMILAFTACNSGNNSAIQMAGNDSLTKRISMMEDTLKQEQINKKLVADFYQQLFGDKDISAIDKYLKDDYIQHNPAAADGAQALKQVVTEWFKGAPKEKIDIQHIGADGNFVYIHTRSKRGPRVVSVIDIFRIDNGKIAEHWDVIQEVPDKSVNPHPMF